MRIGTLGNFYNLSIVFFIDWPNFECLLAEPESLDLTLCVAETRNHTVTESL